MTPEKFLLLQAALHGLELPAIWRIPWSGAVTGWAGAAGPAG